MFLYYFKDGDSSSALHSRRSFRILEVMQKGCGTPRGGSESAPLHGDAHDHNAMKHLKGDSIVTSFTSVVSKRYPDVQKEKVQ